MKNKKRDSIVFIVMAMILSICFSSTAFAVENQVPMEQIATYEVSTGNITIEPMNYGVSRKSVSSLPAISPVNIDWDIPDSGEISPNSIIGEDNREEINTDIWGIAKIIIHWKNGTVSAGTAFVFANDALLTAAHCIYSLENGGWCDYVEIECSRQSSGTLRPFGTLRSTYLHTNTTWIDSQDPNYDYAVIEVGSQIGLQTGLLGISSGSYVGQIVTVTGYPGDNDEHNYDQLTMSGSIKSATTNLVYYEIDTSGGQSGSPVYSNFTAVAVHSGGTESRNRGVRFTTSMVNWFSTFR